MSRQVRLTSTPTGAMSAPAITTPNLTATSVGSSSFSLDSTANGYLKATAGAISANSTIPVTAVSASAISNGYMKNTGGTISASSTIPVASISSSTLTDGFVKTVSSSLTSVSSIPVASVSASALSDGYVKNTSGTLSTVSSIPTSAVSASALSNGVLFNTGGTLTIGQVDTSNLSTAVQTHFNNIDASLNALASGSGSSSGITLDDTVFQIELTSNRHFPNFGRQWITGGTFGNSINVACSGNGKYVITCPNSASPQISSDYGVTFPVSVSGVSSSGCAAISQTGQYMLINESSSMQLSTNYGASFTTVTSGNAVAMSSTGKYMLSFANSKYIYVSSNYGTSWTQVASGDISGAFPSFITYSSAAMSRDGTTMYINADTHLYKSTNKGVSWSRIYVGASSSGHVSCSGDGKYVLLCPTQGTNRDMYLSSDSGSTFNITATGNSSRPYFRSAITTCGRYMMVVANTGYIYVSTNHGSTWTQVGGSTYYYGCAMSQNGDYMYAHRPDTLYICNNLTVPTLPVSQPGNPGRGSMYYDESTNKFYVYNSTSSTWKSVTLA